MFTARVFVCVFDWSFTAVRRCFREVDDENQREETQAGFGEDLCLNKSLALDSSLTQDVVVQERAGCC